MDTRSSKKIEPVLDDKVSFRRYRNSFELRLAAQVDIQSLSQTSTI